jgi:circadian clock protein KaiB
MSGTEYLFRLFVAGNEPNSRLAEHNLRRLCSDYLANRHRIEVVDVLEDFEAALNANIMVAPALILLKPHAATLYGTLTDTAKVVTALALEELDDRT